MARDFAGFSEARRLAALDRCGILDTASDPRFDALARLAAEVCAAPIAQLGFIDDRRHWPKSVIGMTAREIARAESFCDHAIAQPEAVMVVEDASADPRFAANPMVIGLPRVRFYAGAPVRVEDGQAVGVLCIIDTAPRRLDEAGRKRLAELASGVACMLQLHGSAAQLRRLRTHDALTGLPNRPAFEASLDEAVDGALAGRPCGLLMVDIDALRDVNESHGHMAGDALLREAAQRLKRVVRAGDLVVRLGGDEFGIIMPGPVGEEAAHALAGRVVEAMREPVALAGRGVAVSASAGIALCPVDATESAALVRHAHEGLYRAKRGGRGRFARIGGGGGDGATSQRSLGEELRAALDADELSLVWQPYFDTMSGAVAGYEALARWERHIGGAIGPGVFVPVIEATGLSGRFDAWVLEAACRAALQWPDDLTVAINLSSHWFSDGEAVGLIEAVLGRCGLPPHRLVLEMTERTLVTHGKIACEQISRLRDIGARVALDDFGVGFSSLATLREFPFDKVKLDRAFTKDLVVDPRADAVARAVIQLGRALGMIVCAEGVETEAQLAFLRAERCDMVQGYLLGRPSPLPLCRHARPDAPDCPDRLLMAS
jgi:diguanylate cyclase (GGDEF)-like protein